MLRKIMIFFSMILISFAVQAADNSTKYLYIQMASSGRMVYNKDTQSYQLILYKTSPWLVSFTVVPKRYTSLIAADEFVDVMSKQIQQSHPGGLNGALTLLSENNKKPITYTLILKEPTYNARKKVMTFVANFLPGEQMKEIPYDIKFKQSALFIDDMDNNSGGGSGW